MAETTSRLVVEGMHCGSCSMLIDMTLKDLPGVIDSKTSHADGQTTVTYDDSQTNIDTILSAIRGVGYEADIEG